MFISIGLTSKGSADSGTPTKAQLEKRDAALSSFGVMSSVNGELSSKITCPMRQHGINAEFQPIKTSDTTEAYIKGVMLIPPSPLSDY